MEDLKFENSGFRGIETLLECGATSSSSSSSLFCNVRSSTREDNFIYCCASFVNLSYEIRYQTSMCITFIRM